MMSTLFLRHLLLMTLFLLVCPTNPQGILGTTFSSSPAASLSHNAPEVSSSCDAAIVVDSSSNRNFAEEPSIINAVIDGGEVVISKTSQAFDGYNLFVLRKKTVDQPGYNQTLYLTDMDGNVLLRRPVVIDSLFELADVNVELINATTILMGLPSQCALWNLYTDKMEVFNFWGHHDYEYNHNNDTIFTFLYYPKMIDGQWYLVDLLKELNLQGNVVWYLDTGTLVDPAWHCPYNDTFMQMPDLTHSNTIFYDNDEDMIYYNPRNLNTVFKIDHKTGKPVWGLGEHGNFTLIDRYGRVTDSLFYHPHALEKVDDNTIILFDNDLHNQTDQFNQQSRMIEITYNEETMTAYESWTWTGPNGYWCHFWGDADRLPNGDRLGTFGAMRHPNTDLGARLVEVNEAGEIVWTMDFVNTEDYIYGIYRVERIRFAPSLVSPVNNTFTFDEDVVLTWDTFYNFRSKRYIAGEYQVVLNDVLVQSGNVTYDKYWRPVPLTANLGHLPPGTYNLTLTVSDEAGHMTVDSMMVSVVPFYLERIGSTYLEVGQAEYSVQWNGSTISPLNCTISVDGTPDTSFLWNGGPFALNLAVLEIGQHQVLLTLMNGSEEVYRSEFTLTLCPNAWPVIVSSPHYVRVQWNSSSVLTWGVSDCAPALWEVFVNDGLVVSSPWTAGEESITWDSQGLNLGVWNITLLLTDVAKHQTRDVVILWVTPPSPPVILSTPDLTTIQWMDPDVTFRWTVKGGTQWALYKNGYPLTGSVLTGEIIEVSIQDWQAEDWYVGDHELTLTVSDLFSHTTSTTSVRVVLDPGDPYADEFLDERSSWFAHGDRALGTPDGATAEIFLDYGNGYMTLDMGMNEEVFDGPDDDFMIVATGGNYTLSVAASLTSSFQTLGHYSGTVPLDLSSFAIDHFRYIRIEYYDGDWIHLDAIEAINYYSPSEEHDSPVVSRLDDFSINLGQTSVMTWSVSDTTPWSYDILVNDVLVDRAPWYGGDISYPFSPTIPGSWNITLRVRDGFGNVAENQVRVEVICVPIIESMVIAAGAAATVIIVGVLIIRKQVPKAPA